MKDPTVHVRMLTEQIDEIAVGSSVGECFWEWASMLWRCQNYLLWDETSYVYSPG